MQVIKKKNKSLLDSNQKIELKVCVDNSELRHLH